MESSSISLWKCKCIPFWGHERRLRCVVTIGSIFSNVYGVLNHGGHRELKMWPRNPFSKWREDFSPSGYGSNYPLLLCNYLNLRAWCFVVSGYCQEWSSQKEPWKRLLSGGTKLVWFCMFNSREQAIVSKGTVKNTSSLVLSYFFSIFSFKRLFCGPLFTLLYILMFWGEQYLRKKPMFLICWNLQVGADIYAFYNRVVLSCLAGCLSKLWNSCEWWQQTLSGEDRRPFRRKM